MCASTGNKSYDSLPPLKSDCVVRCCLKVRRIGSTGAVLVIVWSLLVFSTASIHTLQLYGKPFAAANEGLVQWLLFVPLAAAVLVGPLAGLLASTYFGRYKTLYTGLWLMWARSVVTVLVFILLRLFPSYNETTIWFSIDVIADIGYCVGFTLFLVTAVPFGLDQMPDASGDQIKAFIHWYSWSFIAGLFAVPLLQDTIIFCMGLIHTFDSEYEIAFLLCSLLNTVLLSATLCSNFLLRGWLTIEPEGSNPLKPFCGILKFAAKHKIPVRRSAFTYWEEEKPSRIDLGKTKYGGPFTNEQVEDVKTCLRMFAVNISFSVATMAFSASVMLNLPLVLSNSGSNYTNNYSSVKVVGLCVCLLYFAVCEVLIHPLIERLFQSTLKKVGLSLTLPIIASPLFLITTAVWYTHTTSTTCMLTSESSVQFPVNPLWIFVPEMILLNSVVFLFHNSILEFICAQAPYVLRGMLVGLMYSVYITSYALGAGIYTAWKSVYQEKDSNSPSCGIWFYLFISITETLGCVLWCVVAKWYKRRERDEPEMCRIFAENYYSR